MLQMTHCEHKPAVVARERNLACSCIHPTSRALPMQVCSSPARSRVWSLLRPALGVGSCSASELWLLLHSSQPGAGTRLCCSWRVSPQVLGLLSFRYVCTTLNSAPVTSSNTRSNCSRAPVHPS